MEVDNIYLPCDKQDINDTIDREEKMRRTTNFYIVRFADLSNEKQSELKEELRNRITSDTEMMGYLHQACGSDPFDIDKPDSDRIGEHIEGAIERGCDEAWYELPIVTTL